MPRQPDTDRVERSSKFDVPPEVVFAQVVDLNRFNKRNPWDEPDEDIRPA